MKSSSTKNSLLIAIGVLVLSQVLFWLWSTWITRTLVDEPVLLGATTVIDRTIRVPVAETYELSLVFPRYIGQDDLRDYLDGEGYFKGQWPAGSASIPVKWSLTNARTNRVAASGVANTLELTAWSHDTVWTHVAHVKVPAGAYAFKAEVLKPQAPELGGAEPRLELALPGRKASSTWQLSVVFWGSLIAPVVIWPLTMLLVGLALWQLRPAKRDKKVGS